MKPILREIAFAFLAWLIPFAVSVCLFGVKTSHPALFDTLMGVVVAASTVLLACLYLRAKPDRYLAHGIRIGIVWMIANWLFDGLMFSSGPMRMSLADYTMDIGLAYLAIPAITIGLGWMAERADA